MSADDTPLRWYRIWLCDRCAQGEGGICWTPGCALWAKSAPDVPLNPEPHSNVEEVDEAQPVLMSEWQQTQRELKLLRAAQAAGAAEQWARVDVHQTREALRQCIAWITCELDGRLEVEPLMLARAALDAMPPPVAPA